VALSKILLYYRFTPITDPTALRLWQRDLCELLGLRGRILKSKCNKLLSQQSAGKFFPEKIAIPEAIHL